MTPSPNAFIVIINKEMQYFFFSLEACKSNKSLETIEFSVFINLLLCCCFF